MVEVEHVVLAFCASLLGGDRKGAGLLVRREGRFHTPRCQFGQYVTAGDSLRGGADCSERCQQTNAALDAAERYLRANERPAQAALLEVG